MMKSKYTSWETKIKKCPHCGISLSLHMISTIGEKHLIGMLYDSLLYHYKSCIIRDQKKIVKLTIEVERARDGSKMISFESNHRMVC